MGELSIVAFGALTLVGVTLVLVGAVRRARVLLVTGVAMLAAVGGAWILGLFGLVIGAIPLAFLRRRLVIVVSLLGMNTFACSQGDGTVMVRGGEFRMGTPSSDVPELKRRYDVSFPGVFEDEIPEHVVTVSDFRMDRYEVTNARFSEFLVGHPEWSRAQIPPRLHNGHYLEHWTNGKLPSAKANHPVVFVTWHAAQALCASAGGRLPTEAEWEYAARSGRDQEFPWGDEPPSAERANYAAALVSDTRPVASYPASPLGLYDMAGNVWEFTLDAWKSGYSGEPQTDPVTGGAVPDDPRTVQGRRVLRGASYGGGVVNLRTRWRDSHEVTNAVAFVGFRCAYPTR